MIFFSSSRLFLEVSPAELKKPSLASITGGSRGGKTNLMETLLKQQPKRVSHLLKDNLPGSSEFYLCSLTYVFE